MAEPGEDPRHDEHQHPHLRKALEDLPQLGIAAKEQLQEQLADGGGEGADVLGEAVSEVGLPCAFHQVVARVVAEENEEDGCHVVETLDVA
jgi:hypothetical protein